MGTVLVHNIVHGVASLTNTGLLHTKQWPNLLTYYYLGYPAGETSVGIM